MSKVSKPMNKANKQRKRTKAECCRTSERSEPCEWTNVVSNRVAPSKHDYLSQETRPKMSGNLPCEWQIWVEGIGDWWKQNKNRCISPGFYASTIVIDYLSFIFGLSVDLKHSQFLVVARNSTPRFARLSVGPTIHPSVKSNISF